MTEMWWVLNIKCSLEDFVALCTNVPLHNEHWYMCNKSAQMDDTSTQNNGSVSVLATNDFGQQFFLAVLYNLFYEFFFH
jgi:hypothetical protein